MALSERAFGAGVVAAPASGAGAKRALDLGLAVPLLALAALPMLAIALVVRLADGGPAMYRQTRAGFNGRHFTVLKFRTLRAEACSPPNAAALVQVTRGDPRVTPLGRVLRRTSLDELPQLLNVIRGDMSLVGPRPHAVAHDAAYAARIDSYLRRHRVRPGITGWAQVHGFRGETDTLAKMEGRVRLDLAYIESRSIRLDLRILAMTARALVRPDAV